MCEHIYKQRDSVGETRTTWPSLKKPAFLEIECYFHLYIIVIQSDCNPTMVIWASNSDNDIARIPEGNNLTQLKEHCTQQQADLVPNYSLVAFFFFFICLYRHRIITKMSSCCNM